MRKSLTTKALIFSFLLTSCAHKPHQVPTSTAETTPKIETDEYTHEMAEATVDDKIIKSEIGSSDIDQDIEDKKIGENSNFLHPKKTQRMQFWVNYFTKVQRERFQRFINNGQEYRHHIEEIFEKNGLPKELYFVGLIESGYYLSAKSHASAVGPWQFIRGTGKRYGLKINHEVDERQDLFKASQAAALYFKDLYNVFSSWELALAAYNAGEYGIIRRIMKYETRDFYELSKNKYLPSETINYVPKVLAAMYVVQNAEKYGFTIPEKNHRLFDRTVLMPVKKNQSLSAIASRLNIDIALLKKLNPELKKHSTPKQITGHYFLRVPKSHYAYVAPIETPKVHLADQEKKVKELISRPETPKEIKRRTAHKVQKGETLYSIARLYEISPNKLSQLNKISIKTKLKTSQILTLVESKKLFKNSLKILKTPIVYKIRRGDNLNELAKIFNIRISHLKKANRLARGQVKVGQKIVLPKTRKGIYTVKKGDELAKLAKKLNQPMAAIIKLNALKRKSIYPGQKIIVNID